MVHIHDPRRSAREHQDRLSRKIVDGEETVSLKARITELRPLGEFATWRAARAAGDHDLNSFLVRVDPAETSQDLQPGMTVWLEPAGLHRGQS